MSSFDPNQYFASRLSQFAASPLNTITPPKNDFVPVAPVDLATTNLEKLSILQATAQQKQIDVLKAVIQQTEQVEAAYPTTWAGSMGLDPHGATAGVVNATAEAASMLGTMAGQVGAQFNMDTLSRNHVPDNVKEARERQLLNIASKADIELLNDHPYTLYGHKTHSGTNLERIKEDEEAVRQAAVAHKYWGEVSPLRESIVDHRRTNVLQNELRHTSNETAEQLRTGWDQAKQGDLGAAAGNLTSGIANQIIGLGAGVLNNPQASAERKARKSNARYAQYPRPPSRGQSRKGRLGL